MPEVGATIFTVTSKLATDCGAINRSQGVADFQAEPALFEATLAARHAVYAKVRERNLARWSGNTRNWSPMGAVALNPRTRLHRQIAFGWQYHSAVGSMTQAAITLTRAGLQRQEKSAGQNR